MNPQMGHPQQAQHMGGPPPPPPPPPPQPLHNAGHQRQAQPCQQQPQGSNGQQQFPGPNQMKTSQGQQMNQNQSSSNEPQLAMFTFERPKGTDSWEDVRPMPERFAHADIEKVLKKLRAGPGDPTSALDKIPSTNCRRIISELVDEENTKLLQFSKNTQWNIAGIKTDWRTVCHRGLWAQDRQQLKRVKVILEIGPAAFQVPQPGKLGGPLNGMQNHNGPKQPNNMSQNSAFLGQPNMPGAPQQRPMPQQQGPHTQQGQFAEPQSARMPQGHMPGPNAPPPPPPPQAHHGISQPPHGMMDGPPPPPPPMQHSSHPPPPPQHGRPQSKGTMHGIPGAFPAESGMRPNHRPSFDEDPRILKTQKVKRRGNQSSSSSSTSSSTTSATDSDEWESDSVNSGHEHVRVRNVEDDYGFVDKRGRSQKHKKSSRDKSHHKAKMHCHSKSRSRSQSRHGDKFARKRRDSGMINSPNISRHNSFSSKENSPRLAPAQPNINVNIDLNKLTEERVREKLTEERVREYDERRTGRDSSPSKHQKDRRRNEKISGAHAMSRDSSFDGGSGTDSYTASSAHTGFDSVFDKPQRRPPMAQRRSHQKSYSHPQAGFNNPHESHIYDHDDDARPSARYQEADDYPRPTARRDNYVNEPHRPILPHRRYTTENPLSMHYAPKPTRTTSFAAGMPDSNFRLHQKRCVNERADYDDEREDTLREFAEFLHAKDQRDAQKRYQTGLEDLNERAYKERMFAEYLDLKNDNRSARRAPPLKRASTGRREMDMLDEDDYDIRFTSSRRSPCNSFDRI
ncbi:hypothetical protein NX059_010781 [Plenodomus lindquistii]|nr:hypothetical protein NX059_010781 [Plenodomus lindquistii]